MAKERYKDSPTLKRDEDSGEMTPTQKKAAEVNSGTDGIPVQEDGIPHAARHTVERMNLHHAHQMEHHAHDHGKHGDKKEMHKRHEQETRALHSKHEKEMSKGSETKGSGDGKEKIEKVESGEA